MDPINDTQSIITILDSFGITKDKMTPLFIVGVIGFFVLWKYFYSPLKSQISSVKGAVSDLHNAASELQKHIKENTRKKPQWLHQLPAKLVWSEAQSPLSLSDRGEKLLEASRMKEYLDTNLQSLLGELELNNPATAYDVQQQAFSVLANRMITDVDHFKKFKDFVFNNPTFEATAIDIPDIIYVGSLVLRDKYLENHTDLKETPFDRS